MQTLLFAIAIITILEHLLLPETLSNFYKRVDERLCAMLHDPW